jgi:hypothetical protein
VSGPKLPLRPLFSRLNVIERHRDSGFHFRSLQPPPSLKPSQRKFRSQVQADTCWIGTCAGCGRTLISATWDLHRSSANVYCTRACRENRGKVAE